MWWNVFGDPERPDPFHDATEPLLGKAARGRWAAGGRESGLDVAARMQELVNHGFLDVEHERVDWALQLDASQPREPYSTFSNIARLPAARRAAVLDDIHRIALVELDDRVERQVVTPVYTAHRR